MGVGWGWYDGSTARQARHPHADTQTPETMSNRNLGFLVGRPLEDEQAADTGPAKRGKRADRSGEEPRATPEQIAAHLSTIPAWVRAASGLPVEGEEPTEGDDA